MTTIELTGLLLCENTAQAEVVRRHLPRHVELTRAEEGCLRFEVAESEDPLVWTVAELFADQTAFDAHQARVRASEWGRATTAIPRDYVVTRNEEQPAPG